MKQASTPQDVVRPHSDTKCWLDPVDRQELADQTLLTMTQLKPHNRCPDCLYMKLSGTPRLSAGNQIDLYLTINFNEQWENVVGGRVKLGLKGGELRLRLINGTMPYEERELAGSLPLALQKKRIEKVDNKTQTGVEAALSDIVSVPAIASKAEASFKMGTEQTRGVTDEFQFAVCQITTKGAEENPAWAFAVETGATVLKGLLKHSLLGVLHVKAKPCRVVATFEVSKRDIYLTDAEGLWPPDISRNKRAVLERMIVLRLLESRFKPYLSQMELHYE